MRTCTRCGEAKELEAFVKDARKPDGRLRTCKTCTNERVTMWKRIARANPEYVAAEKMRDRALSEFQAKHYAAVKRYRARKPEYHRADNQARAAARMQRTPPWFGELDDLILSEAHDLCRRREELGYGRWHVDHIVPLRGRTVCGLHVWNNLQVLPARENIRKRNHFDQGG